MTGSEMDEPYSFLRIYLSDFDRFQKGELYLQIIKRAQELGLRGCSVFRGFWGYGIRGIVHTDIVLEGAGERPIAIDIVDSTGQVRKFAQIISPLLRAGGGLIFEQAIEVIPRGFGIRKSATTRSSESENGSIQRGVSWTQNAQYDILRVFFKEQQRIERKPLFRVILDQCREYEMAGCTIFQGISQTSHDLPLILEVVDENEKIQVLLKKNSSLFQNALVTQQKVNVYYN